MMSRLEHRWSNPHPHNVWNSVLSTTYLYRYFLCILDWKNSGGRGCCYVQMIIFYRMLSLLLYCVIWLWSRQTHCCEWCGPGDQSRCDPKNCCHSAATVTYLIWHLKWTHNRMVHWSSTILLKILRVHLNNHKIIKLGSKEFDLPDSLQQVNASKNYPDHSLQRNSIFG